MKKIAGYLFILVTAGSFSLQAQEASSPEESPETTSTVRGQDVIITAGRVESTVKDSTQTVNVVTADDINNGAAANVGEALRDVPGVTVTDSGIAGMKRLQLRGEPSSRVLILIDGIKISEQKSMEGSPVLIDVSSIERIEVIKGPASVLYGSEAMGGVVNIITKKGGDKPFQGEAGFGFDSATLLKTTNWGLFGGVKGFSYRFNGSYSTAEDRKTAKGKIYDTNFWNYNFNNFVGYDWGSGSVEVRHEAFRSLSNVTAQMSLPHWDRDKVSLSVKQRDIGALSQLSVLGYWQKTYKDFRTMGAKTENNLTDAGVQVQTDWAIGLNHYLIGGIDYGFNYLDATNRKSTGARTTHKGNEHNAALFVQDEWSITNNLIMNFGGRYTYVHSALTDTNDALSPKGTSDNHGGVANVGLLYYIKDMANVRFSYGGGFRTPSLMQKFIAGSKVIMSGGSIIVATTNPNPNLKPEYVHSFETGARFFKHGFDLDLTFAYALGLGYITTVDDTAAGPDTYTYDNANRSHTFTTELVARYEIPKTGLSPYVSGSYLYQKIKMPTYSTTKTGNAPWQGKAGLAFEKRVSAQALLNADFHVAMASAADYVGSANGTPTHHDAWYTLNMSFGGRFSEDGNIGFNVGINNLLNRYYIMANSSVAESGRSFFAKLTAQF